MPDYYDENTVGGIKDRSQIVGLEAYWRDERHEWKNGKLLFKGCHYEHDALITDDNWEIWKYTYLDGNEIRVEGPLPGAWSNRAALSWDASDDIIEQSMDKMDVLGDLTKEILNQLKIMNVYLSILTNEEITNAD